MSEMFFDFSDEHKAFRKTVRRMAQDNFAKDYLERAQKEEFPRAALETLAKHGLLGLSVPEKFGGPEADPISVGIAIEEMARADFNLTYMVFLTAVMGKFVHFLDKEEKEDWAKDCLSGRRLLCVGITEPECGSDAAAIRCRATKTDGGYVLNGEKTSVTMGPHADTLFALVTVDPSLKYRGIACAMVDLDDPSVSLQVFKDPGFKPLGRAGIAFDNTFVPERRVIQPGFALAMILHEFEFTRPLLGLMVTGVAQAAIDMTVAYAKERKAFGKPISRFQGVSFPLAEHQTYLEAGRLLCYKALALRGAGKPCNKEAAMCKWWLPKVGVQAINECIVAHGHVGWSEELPLHQMLVDVSGLQIGDGTPQIQKLIIAREMFGREYV